MFNAIERATSLHLGRSWKAAAFTDLDDRASHPCAILSEASPSSSTDGFAVFAKLAEGPEAAAQFNAELRGLRLLRTRSAAACATPIGAGLVNVVDRSVLLLEALPERSFRTTDDWRSIGHLLAALHATHDNRFGLDDFDGFFGPYRQDNRPVTTNRWSDFYAERRVLPRLRLGVDSGRVPTDLVAVVDRLVARLSELSGPEPVPTLLHGDAQQNNFVSTPTGAVAVDTSPYFGHPELDLSLIDIFEPVPPTVFEAYRERADLDAGFGERRELWRIFSYLAIIAHDGHTPFGAAFIRRLADALDFYR